ncbi:MAG: hypothetical protein PT116_25975 [Aphanizomenon gracile PMC638.10]|nr:hypothetical protein [Aphanizomenon gracile PMC638.10]
MHNSLPENEYLLRWVYDNQVSLVGPAAVDTSWQAKMKTGFDISTFIIDWDKQVAICPQGNLNRL